MSAQPGQSSLDGGASARLTVYTAALLDQLTRRGATTDVRSVLDAVSDWVASATEQRQRPWWVASLPNRVVLLCGAADVDRADADGDGDEHGRGGSTGRSGMMRAPVPTGLFPVSPIRRQGLASGSLRGDEDALALVCRMSVTISFVDTSPRVLCVNVTAVMLPMSTSNPTLDSGG